MIEIIGLWKRYKSYRARDWVIKNASITIPSGVSVGVVGSNGQGKSTLLRLIGGMDHPDKGRVVRHSKVSWPIGLGTGFQGIMTGRQNTKFIARIHGNKSHTKEIIEEVEAFAELGSSFDKPVNTYSSGMKSRLAFGLSLAFDFDVYLSDEATAVGDEAFRKKATRAFKERVGEKSLIMVSHQEGILKDLCQSAIYLNDGTATWYDDINEALSIYRSKQ